MTQNIYFWMAAICALVGGIFTCLKFFLPLLSKWLKKRHRTKYGIIAHAFPYVFAPDPYLHVQFSDGESVPFKLHGFAVEIKGNTDDPYEIIGVELRLNGIDLSKSFLDGWSQSTELDKEIMPEQIKKAYCAVNIPVIHDKKLVANSFDNKGFKLTKNKKVIFFTPIQNPIFALATMIPDCISIVAITTEGGKMIVSGHHLWAEFKETFDNWKDEFIDPNYLSRITLHTVRKHMPFNSKLINTVNDKPILFAERQTMSEISKNHEV